MAGVKTAPMQRGHLRRIADLEQRCFDRPWTRDVLAAELQAANRIYLVAAAGGEVRGYAGAMVVAPDAHILTIAVAPEFRRRGIASALLTDLLAACSLRGGRHATLEVRQSNAAAQALYEEFGFRSAGRRAAYYGDEDAVIMWRLDGGRRTADGGPRSPHSAVRIPQSGRKAAS